MALLYIRRGGADADAHKRTGRARSAQIASTQVDEYALLLERGGAADLAVLQQGVDLVVDVIGPDGALIDTIDSPNGRNGDELVSIAALGTGAHACASALTRQASPLAPTD